MWKFGDIQMMTCYGLDQKSRIRRLFIMQNGACKDNFRLGWSLSGTGFRGGLIRYMG